MPRTKCEFISSLAMWTSMIFPTFDITLCIIFSVNRNLWALLLVHLFFYLGRNRFFLFSLPRLILCFSTCKAYHGSTKFLIRFLFPILLTGVLILNPHCRFTFRHSICWIWCRSFGQRFTFEGFARIQLFCSHNELVEITEKERLSTITCLSKKAMENEFQMEKQTNIKW